MFELMGDPAATAATEAQTVMDLETQLAKASQTEVERREPKNVYHRMPQSGLKTLAPSFPWEDYFTAVGLGGQRRCECDRPGLLQGNGADDFRPADFQLEDLPSLAPDQRRGAQFVHALCG